MKKNDCGEGASSQTRFRGCGGLWWIVVDLVDLVGLVGLVWTRFMHGGVCFHGNAVQPNHVQPRWGLCGQDGAIKSN